MTPPPIVWQIVLGVVGGGIVGFLFSRLFYADRSYSLGSNRPLMTIGGAVAGVVLTTVAFRGVAPALGESVTTTKGFQERVLQSDMPVVVDFHATWCGPCKQLAPVLARLEKDYAGRIRFVRVDIDEAQELAAAHGIRGVPTLLFYANGRQVGQIVGSRPEAALRPYLDSLLDQ